MPVAFSTPRSLASLERSGSFISFRTRMSSVSAACVCSVRRGGRCSSAGRAGGASSISATATSATSASAPSPFGFASTAGASSAAAALSAFALRGLRAGFSGFSSGGASIAVAVASFSSSVSLIFKTSLSVVGCQLSVLCSDNRQLTTENFFSDSRDDLASHFFDSLLRDYGAGDHGRRVDAKPARNGCFAFRQLIVGKLVGFCQQDALIDAGVRCPLVHLNVLLAGRASRIDQQEHQPEHAGIFEIGIHQLTPGGHHRFRYFCVSIAR